MSSFTATDLITYPLPKGHTTFLSGKKTKNWCPTCQILIGTGRVGISLLKGRIGCVMRKSGRQCLVVILATHGLSSENQVEPVSCSFAYFILTLLIPSTFS